METLDVLLKFISIPALIWTILSAFLITRYRQNLTNKSEKIKNLEKLISEEKTGLYKRIFAYFFDAVKAEKIAGKHNTTKMGKEIIDVKKDALIFAPAIIVKQIVKWQEKSSSNPQEGFKEYMRLLHLIRDDLGHEPPLTDDDILGSFMNDPVDKLKMKTILDNI